MIKKIYNNKIIFWFFMLQPFIDVITAFMIKNTEISLTLGIVIRTVFLFYSLMYLLFFTKQKKKYFWIYISLIFLYCLVMLLVNFNLNPNFIIVREVTNLAKLFYFPVLCFFFYAFTKDGHKISLRSILIPTSIIGGIILFGDITNTGNVSYGTSLISKIGQVGWFYSPNEIGALLGVLFPLIFYVFAKDTTKYTIGLLLINMYSLFIIGTKVAFLSMVITIFGVILFKFFRWIFYKEQISKKLGYLFLSVLLVFVLVTPFAPITHNMGVHLTDLRLDSITDIFGAKNEVENVVFNGREDYLKETKKVYEKSTKTQQIIGTGRESNFIEEKKVKAYIERDFHDVFYANGVLGFVLFLVPLVCFLLLAIKRILFDIKNNANTYSAMLLMCLCIGLGAAYISGHVLLAPAVSIYVALILSLLYVETDKKVIK